MYKKLSIQNLISKYSLPIKEVLIDRKLSSKARILIENLGFDKKTNILLVGDENTKQFISQISLNLENYNLSKLILEKPKSDNAHINQIINRSSKVDLIIGLGSGTISDLCKFSSFKKNIPYIIFATAPSMNGYASKNASIMVDGHKTSILAHLPMAIYVDLDFTKTASDDLIKAGIGDSLCYSTCNFDWLLSHLILKTPFDEEVFKILQPFQEELLNYQGNLRDEKFMQLLYEILIISGISMTICKGSYPASQGEHLIAHYLEMKYPKILEVHFHGLQIAVTTLSMIEIQEKFLKANELKLKNFDINLSYLINLFDKNEEVALNCRNELQQKNISNQKLIGINEDLKNTQKELLKVFISKEKILDIYKKFSLPQKPQDLEINQEIYEEALNNAFIIRNRLTSLDFIYQ